MPTWKIDGRYYTPESIRHMEKTLVRLWEALLWIDTYSPEDTAAVEARFGLDLKACRLTGKAAPTGAPEPGRDDPGKGDG